jgi:predicted HTH domain antitoxin
MTITIPDETFGQLRLTPEQTCMEIAVGLFADRRVTLARAAKIAGVSFLTFQREMARRRIPLHYETADFEADVRTLAGMDPQ